MPLPDRETARLRWGRVSIPVSKYFVTICTQFRAPVLSEPAEAERVTKTMAALHANSDIDLLAATVMPDHVHLLFVLGENRTVGQVQAKFKNLARDKGRVSWRWQNDGFEHHLRPHESIEDYGFYIFMNPYRARLCTLSTRWPWWLCPSPEQFRFLGLLDETSPVPEQWLNDVDRVAETIVSGE